MKHLFLLVAGLSLSATLSAQIYMAKTCEISLFSASPLENIEATNKAAKPIMNTATNDIQVKIAMSGFSFPSPLMQEHFNENYVETEKYPNCVYKGKINETIDWKKDGEYKVTVDGTISLHGVDKPKKLDGTVKIKGSEITITTSFKLHIADYNIQVPSLYVKNIAEEVDIKLNAILEPFVKK